MPTPKPTGLRRIRNQTLRRAALLFVIPFVIATATGLSITYGLASAATSLLQFLAEDLPAIFADCWNRK